MTTLLPRSFPPRKTTPIALRTRVVARSTAVLLLALLIAVLPGCGESDPKPTGAQAQPVGPLENPQNNAPAEERPAPVRPVPKPAAVAQEEPGIDPSTNPHDVFEVTATMPTFERAEGLDGPVSMNKFDAVFPPKGSDSSDFELTQAPDVKASTPHAAPETTPEAKQTDKPAAKGHSTAKSGKASKENSEQAADKSESDSKRSLPSGFHAIAGSGYSPVGWPMRIRSSVDGAEMALVTGGAVIVGHDGDPPESSPQITVVVDSFYMDLSEVTLARYKRYRKEVNEEHGRHAVQEPENASSPANFPVLGVTLKQAEFYAHWAKKELPSEAEWERGARGEAAFAHPWGNGRAIWSHARDNSTITPVRSFGTDVSPFGIYDLAGNAREWCIDRWSPTAFADAQKSSSTPLRNWKGPRNAPVDVHVVKGNGPGWDAWYRAGMNATQHHPDVGFRCVLRLNEKN
jgi:formylglycine-generating enzyme required for sulfatase activity